MKEIKLSHQGKYKGKYVALVDDEDYQYLGSFNWCVMKNRNTFYAGRAIRIDGRQTSQLMHNAIMNGKGIDHRDMNGLNNQKSNLRFCTISQNQMNKRKKINCTSIYKGVYFEKANKKWRARIKINGKAIHLGYFMSEVDAAKAYNEKAAELFGKFTNLNVIN